MWIDQQQRNRRTLLQQLGEDDPLMPSGLTGPPSGQPAPLEIGLPDFSAPPGYWTAGGSTPRAYGGTGSLPPWTPPTTPPTLPPGSRRRPPGTPPAGTSVPRVPPETPPETPPATPPTTPPGTPPTTPPLPPPTTPTEPPRNDLFPGGYITDPKTSQRRFIPGTKFRTEQEYQEYLRTSPDVPSGPKMPGPDGPAPLPPPTYQTPATGSTVRAKDQYLVDANAAKARGEYTLDWVRRWIAAHPEWEILEQPDGGEPYIRMKQEFLDKIEPGQQTRWQQVFRDFGGANDVQFENAEEDGGGGDHTGLGGGGDFNPLLHGAGAGGSDIVARILAAIERLQRGALLGGLG